MNRSTTALCCAASLLPALWSTPAGALTWPTKLFLSQDGLALSRFPGRHVLSKTIQIGRTAGTTTAGWVASSDQPWLQVTSSGSTGGKLTVTANPSGLTTDQFYSANVTVSTSGADFTDTEVLHVGLWVGSALPGTVEIQKSARNIATNPVSPVAYVTDGSSSIVEYNVYSGRPVGTFKKVAPTIGYMEVSSDGETLFATDTTNYRIIALDAKTGAFLGRYKIGYSTDTGGFNIVYARPFGQPALYVAGAYGGPNGYVMAYPSGEKLADGIEPTFLAVTPDGENVFSITTYEEPSTIFGYKLGLNSGTVSLTRVFTAGIQGENCQDMAVSQDGKHVYPACGAPYEFDVYSGKTGKQVQTLPANPYPTNVEVDESDNLIGGIDDAFQQTDVYVYNQKGYSLGTVPDLAGYEQVALALKVSGDGTRVISAENYYEGGELAFRELP